jgi:hypothetical protein
MSADITYAAALTIEAFHRGISAKSMQSSSTKNSIASEKIT